MWKQFLKDYFVFTRKERRGTITIVIFILLITILPLFFPLLVKDEPVDHSEFALGISKLIVDSLDKKYAGYASKEFENDYSPEYRTGLKKVEFYFDPNTATITDWVKLGIKEKTATTIHKYISKGGKFYKAEDIRKIWGLAPKDADRLIPYVSIKKELPKYVVYEKTVYPERKANSFKPGRVQNVLINSADTTSFKNLPGIGSKLSQRIINFRNKLGGFYSVDQVGETFLLPDSTFRNIKSFLVLDDLSIRKININTASLEDLKVHPYIRYYVANAIVQYRNQHGNFNSVEEIKKIMIVTDSVYLKVAPYLSLD